MHKHYFLTFILLTFISCGTVTSRDTQEEVDSNQDNNERLKEVSMTCKEAITTKGFHKAYSPQSVQIETPNRLMLLLAEKPTSKMPLFDNQGLYKLFQTEYFWANKTKKNLDVSTYTEPQKLIDDLKYKKDRWSFAVTPELYNDAVSQKSVGFGFSCQDIGRGCLITYVRIDSPADKIDLRRGDIVQKIDNQIATQERIYAQGQEEKLLTFELLRPNSNKRCSGNILPKEYTYKVVASKTIKSSKNETVGYLRIDSFLGDNEILAQIENAFNNFKKNAIEKLVIDLRYNGGGSVDLASKLLDKLVINKKNQTQFTLAWNEAYASQNQTYTFDTSTNALDLKQILFLTTQNSASASELLISAMKPYLPEEDVVIIGDKTHGKPVGMSGQFDGSYYYFLINFVVKNALGFYDYFEGLPVTSGCAVADDPFHEMGDPKESMLKSALHYIDTGSCQ